MTEYTDECIDCGSPLIDDEITCNTNRYHDCADRLDDRDDCPIGGCKDTRYKPKSLTCHSCISGVRGDIQRKERMEQ